MCDHKQQLSRQRATTLFGDGIRPIPGSTVRALTWTFTGTCAIPMHENLDIQIQMCTHNILIRCNAKFDTLRSIIAPCNSFFYLLGSHSLWTSANNFGRRRDGGMGSKVDQVPFRDFSAFGNILHSFCVSRNNILSDGRVSILYSVEG